MGPSYRDLDYEFRNRISIGLCAFGVINLFRNIDTEYSFLMNDQMLVKLA